MMSVNLEKTLEHLTIMKAYGMKISLSIIYIRGHSIIKFLKMRTKANRGGGSCLVECSQRKSFFID